MGKDLENGDQESNPSCDASLEVSEMIGFRAARNPKSDDLVLEIWWNMYPLVMTNIAMV